MSKKILDIPPQNLTESEILTILAASDSFVARITEDVIGALLRVGIIQPRDLPDKAREVLEARAELRRILAEIRSI